ncbi:hypothetical protein KC19_6G096700 [Ceratodon purpureus]|uniref:Kinesin motor domain-containing protein n=1 Tax=Ceratodon purpureus TaxID=3225 RepID=A0A8T0HDC3_CERPU|nr:hypothetical protein KC19_6G096700 [Ceratodon purpureus]
MSASTMMSPKPSKGMQGGGNGGSRTPTKVRPMQPFLDRQVSRTGSHPVEVVGRIREHPEGNERESAIRVLPHSRVAVRAEGMGNGCREFSLDGVSLAAVENLQAFYGRYVESRVEDVKAGGRCTIMMYGPTGAGKSYTMFGAAHEKGVAYHALSQLMSQRGSDTDGEEFGEGSIEVRATVWEIYNEEIYDLLASVSAPKSGFGTLFKMSGSSGGRVKLEVMGKKVKTCMSISGTDPQKLLREISKVEGRRVVKGTNCNERSSRSHCMVTIDVPEVGGKLILVDMAGSENIDQAGLGRELKMQTGKINQGNGALKRVVEAIANGDSYIPYRDSKLTMLLQDSFEDDRAKILMILCASPDVRDLHKTICTLEYGAKAKCIVRLPNSPSKEQVSSIRAEQVQVLEARLTKKDAYIEKLRKENEEKHRQNEEREKELERKDRELAELREKERRRIPEKEVQKKRKGLHDGDDEDLNMSPTRRRKIEELTALVASQQRELDLMRIRAEKAEAELLHLQRSYNLSSNARVGHMKSEIMDAKESGVENSMDKRMAGSFGQSPVGSNQRFQDIQKQMSDRIAAAQAESERIIAQCTPELKSGHRSSHIESISRSSGDVSGHDGSRQERDVGSTSDPSDVNMSLTATSPSLMLLKNLVKEKERRSSLGYEDATQSQEPGPGDASAEERTCEDGESEAWTGERLCSKGWLPIILEEDERIAQSIEFRKSATPQGSGAKDYSSYLTQVTPEMANPATQEKVDDRAESYPSLTFPSPEEQFNTAIASYSNRNSLVGSPLFAWGGSASKHNDPSPTGAFGFSAGLDVVAAVGHSDFVSGEMKDWTPHEVGQQERRLTSSAIKTYSPLTALAEGPPSPSKSDRRGDEDEPISTMMPLSESPVVKLETHEPAVGPAEPVLLNVGTDLFDGGQSGGSDAEAARRARIESIFLLCGERRELTRKLTGMTPVGKESHEESADVPSSGRYSPTASSYGSQLDQSISDFSTSPSFSDQATYYTDVSVSSLPSLMPAVSPQRFPSSRRPTRRMSTSIFANENSQPRADGVEKTDVYVKWEKSSEAAEGKPICIVNVPKSSSLSELREEVETHIPVSKKDFKFLFLGETGGAPVDREFEGDVRVGSLPASQESHGSRLACLRPPVTETVFASPRVELKPFRALENQLPSGNEQTIGSMLKGKSTPVASPGRGSPGVGHSKGLRAYHGESGRPKSALAHIVDSSRCM